MLWSKIYEAILPQNEKGKTNKPQYILFIVEFVIDLPK